MTLNSRATRNPTSFVDDSRKRTLFNFKLSILSFLTIILCEQLLVMPSPLPSPSFNVASTLAEVSSKNYAVGIKDATTSLGTIKTTESILDSPRDLDPIAGPSPNPKHSSPDTLKSDDLPKMDDGSGNGEKGLSRTLSTDKSGSPGNQIPPEGINRLGQAKSYRILNWNKKTKQYFSNLIQRMKLKKTPSKDKLVPPAKNSKQTLGTAKTAVNPSLIKLVKFILERFIKSLKVKHKNSIKERAARDAHDLKQLAIRVEDILRIWLQLFSRPRPTPPRYPQTAA